MSSSSEDEAFEGQAWRGAARVADEEVRELFGRCGNVVEIKKIKNNDDPRLVSLSMEGSNDPNLDSFAPEAEGAETLGELAWERLGSYVAGNDHLQKLAFHSCCLNDSKAIALFRGLTKSDTLTDVLLANNTFGISGIRQMVPFLKSSPNITTLGFFANGSINTECFNLVLETLDGRGMDILTFGDCNIDSLAALGRCKLPRLGRLNFYRNCITDIPAESLANCTHLTHLSLSYNSIGEGGFRAVANLLQKEDCSLTRLGLERTGMGDDEAEMIADSLRRNKKLEILNARGSDFGPEGLTAFLKLLNDVSSMDATGNSNHTLRFLYFDKGEKVGDNGEVGEITKHIKGALIINRDHWISPAAAGRDKVVKTLLDRAKRMKLSCLQGIDHSSDHYLFSGIDPILLPNVLGLANATSRRPWRPRGLSELYRIMVVVAPDLVSLTDRKALLKEAMAKNEARRARNGERLAAIAAEQATLAVANSRMEKELVSIEADEGRQVSGKKRGRDTP